MLIRQLISKSKLYFLYLSMNHFALVIARLIFNIYGLPLNCKNDYFPKSLSMQLRCHCLLSKIHQFTPRVINFYRKYFSICLPLNTRNFSYLIGVHSVNFTKMKKQCGRHNMKTNIMRTWNCYYYFLKIMLQGKNIIEI